MGSKKLKIILSIGGVLLVAVLGTIFVNIGMDWFNSLEKPSQWISNFVIPIVWSVIYLSAGIVLFLWHSKSNIPLKTSILFIINGALNVLWCLIFFTLRLTFLGNIVIIINLIFAYIILVDIFKQNKVYGYMLALYPVWLSLATSLNIAIWILN